MNKYILLVLMLLSCNHIVHDDKFYNTALSDFRDHSYFLTVIVKTHDYQGKAIIENDNLFNYYNDTANLTSGQYIKIAYNNIANNTPIILSEKDLEKWRFIKVPSVKQVEDEASKNLDKFIRKYFNNKALKQGISESKKTAIIYQLYKQNILCNIDDESGYLILNRETEKQPRTNLLSKLK